MCMRLVHFFNVGYGDCFILENKEEAMLVDCGTKQKLTNIQQSLNLINSIMNKKEQKVGLLSHFHSDHLRDR